ncbi:MAG: GAF domain-containing sensor histidine kinase [Parcubacteria group bacterium]|nr:GAF domain-containing sensor histidine kinase [Parcubacteria group bacterium]
MTALDNKNKDLQALFQISTISISSLRTNEVVQNILDSVPQKFLHLEYSSATIALYEKDLNHLRAFAITKSDLVDKSLKLLKKDFRDYTLPVDAKNPLAQTFLSNEIHIVDGFSKAFSGIISSRIIETIAKLAKARSVIAVPLRSRGGIAVGILIFVCSRNGSDITKRDQDIVTNFANNLGLTLENTKLYAQIEKNVNELAEKSAELEAANNQLRQFDEAKSEFISIASHQLRTPLTVIKGYLSMVNENFFGVVPQKLREVLQKVVESTDRLIALVNDLLDISRIESGRMKYSFAPLSFEILVRSVAEGLDRMAQNKGLGFEIHIPKKKLPKIHADEQKLRQVILNVIDNAVKYTDKGKIDIFMNRLGSEIEFVCQDTGRGIEPQDIGRLFQKFARGSGIHVVHTEGTGLGLFVGKKIVEAHGGSIWAESEGIGKGSKFVFRIPLKPKIS